MIVEEYYLPIGLRGGLAKANHKTLGYAVRTGNALDFHAGDMMDYIMDTAQDTSVAAAEQ